MLSKAGCGSSTAAALTGPTEFPGIEAAARDYMPNTMILDGEAVVLDEQGRFDFGRLQNSLGAGAANCQRGTLFSTPLISCTSMGTI
jgi:hypothetical protein